MKIIKALWVAGIAGLGIATMLPASPMLVVQAVAVLLCLMAWCAAVCRAAHEGEMRWVLLIALMPSITMWFYLFRRRGVTQRPVHLEPAFPIPTHPPRPRFRTDVAMQQALEVIREAEREHPEW
jgi:hypothetical protein